MRNIRRYYCHHINSRVWINRVRLGCQSCSWSAEQGIRIFPCPRSRLGIWSRATGSGRIWCLLTGFLLISSAASIYLLFIPPYAIRSVPSLSGHAIARRWRSLPRVRWHRTSSPQGSSGNGCCLCITMDQLICASLFSRPLLLV